MTMMVTSIFLLQMATAKSLFLPCTYPHLRFITSPENDGKGHFTDAGKRMCDYFNVKRSGRGMAVWDYDNDGDLDINRIPC
jgi:hypothetical protein